MIVNITYTPNDCKALITSVEQKMCINIAEIGSPGLSAYQLAVAQGFVGTLDEWLDSLKQKNYIGRHLYENNVSWCGIALEGSLESDEVWKITKITVNTNGTTTTEVFENVAWLDFHFDNATKLFLAATGITDTTIKNAINTFVVDSKNAGVWSKMKAIYPFVGGTATTHKFNLVNSADTNAAFRLAFNGGWTHNSNGIVTNGTNTYADTFFIPSSNLTETSQSSSIYSRVNTHNGVGFNVDFGSATTNGNFVINAKLSPSTGALTRYGKLSDVRQNTNESAIGYFVGSRTANNVLKLFKNGSQIAATGTIVDNGISNLAPVIGGERTTGGVSLYTNRQYSFATIGDGLTDEDSANLYYSVQKFQTTLGRQVGTPIYSSNATDVNARLFLGATNIQDATITSAVDTLVQGLKTDGVWSKLKAVYPFVGGTATTHKFNLANALDENASFRLAFSGGWTHSTDGALPNGTNGYADTFFVPSTNLSLGSNSFGMYSRTSDLVGNKINGVFNAAFTSALQLNISAGTMFNGAVPSLLSYTASPTTGLILATRTSTTLYKGFRNNVFLGSNSTTMTLLPNISFYLGARNEGGSPQLFNSYQHAFAFLGDGLTDDDSANLYYSVQKFQTSLARNI